MDRRIENIERERVKKPNKSWVFFILIPIFGGLFYYFTNIQTELDKNNDSLKNQINNLRINEKDLTALVSDQKVLIQEQKIVLDRKEAEIIRLKEIPIANSSSSEEKLKLELELQKKIITISNLENQIIILNNELSKFNEIQEISSLISEIKEDAANEKSNRIEQLDKNNESLSSLENDNLIPKIISSVPPKYPSRAVQRNLSGEVELVFDIDQFGRPLNIRILKSTSSLFEASAIAAIEKAVYSRPNDRDGNAVRYLDMTKKYVWKLE